MANQDGYDHLRESADDQPSDKVAAARIADAIALLDAAGYTILSEEDVEWGECPSTPGEPHRVALNMCSGCLEYDPE